MKPCTNPDRSARFDVAVLWQLSRFNTRESLLAWYPAISSRSEAIELNSIVHLVFFNWLCMTLFHATFCTWNDILDRHIDTFAARTATRPLPSGRCSVRTAVIWVLTQAIFTACLTTCTLGPSAAIAIIPSSVLAAVYPFAKRVLPWPQFVLAPSLAGSVFVGWISVTTHLPQAFLWRPGTNYPWQEQSAMYGINPSICLPLALAYASWTIYFDTAYGLQDIDGDRLSGIGSLAQFLGRRWYNPFMVTLNGVTILLLAIAVRRAASSSLVWGLGIGWWVGTIPVQKNMLRPDDPKSGGAVFKFNIKLGLQFTLVLLLEALVKVFHMRYQGTQTVLLDANM